MNTKPINILLIEDNPADSRLIRELLKEAGGGQHEITCADQLCTGLANLIEQHPDVVLLDLGLPDSQGLDTFTRVKDSASGIPVVILTGMDDETVGTAAVNQGAQDYLTKGGINGKALWRVVRYSIERMKLAEEIKESEQRYRSLIESIPIGVSLVQNGKIVYANQWVEKITGYSLDELMSLDGFSLIYPEDRANVRQYYSERRQLGKDPGPYSLRLTTKDGRIRWLDRLTTMVTWNHEPVVLVIDNDITERKQSEEALLDSEKFNAGLLENSPNPIYVINNDSSIKYVNPAMLKLTGFASEELLRKKPPYPWWPPEKHSEYGSIQQQYKFETGHRTERLYQKKNGDKLWIDSNISLVGEKQSGYFIANWLDITERKKAEEERQRLEEKAQIASRLAAVGEMAAGIAHEINNPLTGVLGFSKLLGERENVPEELKEELKIIADGSQRVADIVRRLLTFARQTKPIRTSVNLNGLIDNTLKLREYVLKTANIAVVTHFDPELPWSQVDPGQLQQVFLNLIVNAEQAIKGAHGKGTLTIITQKQENNIHISFRDDGPGITQENMQHMFEPFFTTKAVGEGTGLGLSLSRSIILEHGGEMHVESEPGQGASFIIEIPLSEVLSLEADIPSPVAIVKPAGTQKGRILVVDDEPGVRELIEKVLTQTGYLVDTLGDAKEALDKVAGTKYDLLFVDIRMPGMSGIELYAHLQAKVTAMAKKIIFITGDVMGRDVKAFLTQNNLAHLAKPFDIQALKEKVDRVIKASRPENEGPDRKGT